MMLDEMYGEITLRLNEMIEKSGLSKNKVAFKAEIQRTQLNIIIARVKFKELI